MTPTEIALIAGAYVLGGFCAAYYLVRWKAGGEDVRSVGSGNAGATNASRLLGRTGFLGVFGLDLLKGIVAVGVARLAGAGTLATGLVMLAVVVGHILPVQLRFRGGKGVSTAMGALLAFDSVACFTVVGLFLPCHALIRRFTFSGLAALAVTPVILLALFGPTLHTALVAGLVAIVLLAHHEDLKELVAGSPAEAEVEG